MKIRIHTVVTIFLAVMFFSVSSHAASDSLSCGSLVKLKMPNTDFVLAATVSAGSFKAPDGNQYEVPAFCRVHGIARPSEDSEINFEVWLPKNNWNGRYYQVGTGGFAGRIPYGSMADSLNNGNAVAGADMGHVGKVTDASWALGHPEKIIDFGYRGLKETTKRAKLVVNSYYGKKADHSYFAGCSNGGREALMVAQRFPEDWDGILVGAPANFLTFTEVFKVSNEIAQWTTPNSHIPHAKLPAIQKAALVACRQEAQVINGVAADPRFCRLDPASMICEGEESDACLTKKQAKTLKAIYDGPKNPLTNSSIFPGLESTFESGYEWRNSVLGTEPGQTRPAKLGRGFFAYMALDNPDLDIYNMDFGDAIRQANNKKILGQTLPQILNSDNPNLNRLRDKGGKILMYYGWGDTYLPPQGGINYYQSVANAMGGLEKIQEFYRLFMVPGMGHCAGGPGANAFGQFSSTPGLFNNQEHNVFRVLESWVEKDIAPESIIATKYNNNVPKDGVAFTRPLCLYPKVPVYNGKGEITEAKSFSCKLGFQP